MEGAYKLSKNLNVMHTKSASPPNNFEILKNDNYPAIWNIPNETPQSSCISKQNFFCSLLFLFI